MGNVVTILLKWSKVILFKVKNLSLILLVSYGISLVNAAQVAPDPGAAGPANSVVLGEGRMPKTLEVLAMRTEARRFIRLPQNQNLNFNDIDRYIQGLRILQSAKAQFRDEVIRQYYLLRGQYMPGINYYLAREIYRFSIQELLDNGRLPAIVNNRLDLSGRYIADLDGLTQIPGLNNLQILDLYGNHITQIQPDAFRGLGNLQILNLGFNHITKIQPNAFQGLGNLQILNLSYNRITQIQPNAFLGLGNLRELYLFVNQITQIHANTFRGLGNLEDLYLRNNQIIPDQRAQLNEQIQGEIGHGANIIF